MNFLRSFGQENGFSFGDQGVENGSENVKGGPSRAKTALMYVLGSTAFAITILVKFAETAG